MLLLCGIGRLNNFRIADLMLVPNNYRNTCKKYRRIRVQLTPISTILQETISFTGLLSFFEVYKLTDKGNCRAIINLTSF